MGILGLFRKKDEVVGAKVLVCALDSRFADLLRADTETYKRYYPDTTDTTFVNIDELMRAITQRYDVVHLLCDVSPSGAMGGSDIIGTELIERCCASNVKLLWVASSNAAEGYIKGFKARGKRLNLVMTINRHGPKFSNFLEKLLARMSHGDAMPVAWNELCPQVPGSGHQDSPDAIFFAGRGSVRLR
jgi:hypothetical protein